MSSVRIDMPSNSLSDNLMFPNLDIKNSVIRSFQNLRLHLMDNCKIDTGKGKPGYSGAEVARPILKHTFLDTQDHP